MTDLSNAKICEMRHFIIHAVGVAIIHFETIFTKKNPSRERVYYRKKVCVKEMKRRKVERREVQASYNKKRK